MANTKYLVIASVVVAALGVTPLIVSSSVDKALEQPQAFTAMRKNARKTVVERYELGACLAKTTNGGCA